MNNRYGMSEKEYSCYIEQMACKYEKTGISIVRLYVNSILVKIGGALLINKWFNDFYHRYSITQDILYEVYRKCDKDISVKMVNKQ